MRDIEGTAGSCRRINSNKKLASRSGSEPTVGTRSRNCSESERSVIASTPEPTAVLMMDFDGLTMKTPLANGSAVPEETPSDSGDTRLCNSLINLPTFLRHGTEKIPHEVLMTITNNPRLYAIVLDNYPALFEGYIVNGSLDEEECPSTLALPLETNKQCQSKKDPAVSPLEEAATAMLSSRMEVHRHHHSHPQWNAAYLKGLKVKKRSLTYRGAMLNLPRYRLRASSCPDIYRNSITTIARDKEGVRNPNDSVLPHSSD